MKAQKVLDMMHKTSSTIEPIFRIIRHYSWLYSQKLGA
ncbi:hypothetical protein yrohd0001_36450 [Yersinia rohdei ATCC 43380]|nr:hypothetical protein yrohd0001_36450 [Yersinia rohdei ATCC 43380]